MPGKISKLVFAGMIAGAAACQAEEGLAAGDPAAEVRQAMVEVVGAAAKLDADGILARLDQGPDALFFVQGQTFTYAELGPFLRQQFGDMLSQQVIWRDGRATVLGPDTVLWTSWGRNPLIESTSKCVEYLLTETWLWRRTDGVWRAFHYHESFLSLPGVELQNTLATAVRELAGQITGLDMTPDDAVAKLEEFLRTHPEAKGAAFAFAPAEGPGQSAPYVYRKGSALVRKQLSATFDFTQAAWYAEAVKRDAPGWSEPYFDVEGAGVMMITYSVPVKNADGKLVGVLTADLALY